MGLHVDEQLRGVWRRIICPLWVLLCLQGTILLGVELLRMCKFCTVVEKLCGASTLRASLSAAEDVLDCM
jgi:hypothetical protein